MSVSRSLRPALGGLLAVVLPVALLSACSGAGDDPRDEAPVLEVAWTIDDPGTWRRDAPQVATDDLWIYRDDKFAALAGVRLKDGTVAWRIPVGEVCAFSTVNAAGLLGVQSGMDCTDLAVVDTTSGEVAWSAKAAHVGRTHPTDDGHSVGLSENTLTVAGSCGVERWSVANGRALGHLEVRGVTGDEKEFDCRGQATTGTLAILAGPQGMTAYDADTGAVVWNRAGRDAAVARVYSVDPLVVDVDIAGLRAVRTLSSTTGELGPILGRPLPGIGRGPSSVDPVGDPAQSEVIGIYDILPAPGAGYASALRSWNSVTGEEGEVHVRAPVEHYLGADEHGTYLGRTVAEEADDDDAGNAYWVTRRDPGADTFRTLGWVKDSLYDPVRIKDLLITGDGAGRSATAYRLPSSTVGVPAPESVDGATQPDWAKGDLRPDPQVDACAAVTVSTLTDLGFGAATANPAPLDCRWTDGRRQLLSKVDFMSSGDGDTAVERAKANLALRKPGGGTPPVEVDGLGDEAWMLRETGLGVTTYGWAPGVTGDRVVLLVRSSNVVVELAITPDAFQGDTRLPPAFFRTEEAFRTAALEVLAAAGVDPDGSPPAQASDGPVTAVPDLCPVLLDQARELLPGRAARDLTVSGEDRLRGCIWSAGPKSNDDFVQVLAYAAGPSVLTGVGADTEARRVFEASTDWSPRDRVPGQAWDEGWIRHSDPDAEEDAHIAVRAGNVVIVVNVHLDDPDGRDATAAANTMVRQLAKAISN